MWTTMTGRRLAAVAFLVAVAGGLTYAVELALRQADPADNIEARVVLGRTWSDVVTGRFDEARDRVARSVDADPNDSQLTALLGWITDYCELAQQRELLRDGKYAKQATTAKEAAEKGEWVEATRATARAYLSAASPEQFYAEPWVRKLTADASDYADTLRRQGDWTEAVMVLAYMRDIYPDDEQLDNDLRVCSKHALLEAVYTVDNEDEWKPALRDIREGMIKQALYQISLNYVENADFKHVAKGGLTNLLAVCETPQLTDVFEHLGHPELVGPFTGRVRAILAEVDRRRTISPENVYTWFSELLALNERTIELPREIPIVEFMDGALEPLDDFSAMIWPQEVSEFRKHTTGHFSGVGIQITMEGNKLAVVSPLEDTPAYRAGIQPGDLIVKIDGRSTEGITVNKAVRSITGPEGMPVVLTIKREGVAEPFDVEIIRDNITIHSVKGYARVDRHWDYMADADRRIAYIRLTNFSENTADELGEALKTLDDQGARGLILDLRFNPGGLLRAAIEVSDMFLDSGKTIVSTKSRSQPPWSGKANQRQKYPNLPLIVLLNKYSASASEIVAGAIQDNHRGLVLGQRSYGKGSVQNLIPIGDGNAYLKLTTAFYYLPSGRCIDRHNKTGNVYGVDPDLSVVLIPEELRKIRELWRDREIITGRELDAQNATSQPAGEAIESATPVEPLDATESDGESVKDADDDTAVAATTQPAEDVDSDVPDVDPQLEAALLVMRVKLMSGMAWRLDGIDTTAAAQHAFATE